MARQLSEQNELYRHGSKVHTLVESLSGFHKDERGLISYSEMLVCQSSASESLSDNTGDAIPYSISIMVCACYHGQLRPLGAFLIRS
jgi:hypothetical protein